MSVTMTEENWLQKFHTQGLLLLREIPETLSKDDTAMMLQRTTGDDPYCSRSSECGQIGNIRTCVQLLYQIFCRALFALTLNQYEVQTVLLRKTSESESSDVSITLDSFLSCTDEKRSESSSCACPDMEQQSSMQSNTNDVAVVSDHSVPSKPIPINGAIERDAQTEVPLKWGPSHAEGSQTDMGDCSNTNKNSCSQSVRYGHSTSVNTSNTIMSKELLWLTGNCVSKDEMLLLNGQVEPKVKRYALRKRRPCDSNNALQTEVLLDNEEAKNSHRIATDDETTSKDDRNRVSGTKPKQTSRLKQADCLVMKQPVCCICGLLFPSTSECIMHCRQDHIVTDPLGNVKPHIACKQCPVRFAVPASRLGSDLHIAVQVARWLNHAVSMHDFPIPPDVKKFSCVEPGCSFFALSPASFQTHRQKNRHGGVIGCGTSAVVYFKLRCFLCTAAEGGREIFPSKSALREHVMTSHVQRDQVREFLCCPLCTAERPLTRHRTGNGDKSRPMPCRRFFYVVYRLLHHLVSKHGWSVPEYIQSFPCKFPGCQYIAVAQSDLASHSISHDRGEASNGTTQNPSMPCEKCGKLVTFRAMRSHLRLCQVSLEDRRKQQCSYCSKRLLSQYSLRHHIKAVHSNESSSKEFLCSYCSYSCRVKSNLEEHVFHRHGSNISRRKVISCYLCPYTTIKPGALHRHTSLVHSDAKTFRCPVCDKMFKCKVHLKNHMVAHEDRRFACPSCSYRAARKANLDAHILVQHSNNRKSYRCDEPCQYSTGYAANLRKHQRLSCKYRRRSDNGGELLINRATDAAVVSAVPSLLLELDDKIETATGGDAVTGISEAAGTVASGWRIWSSSAVNSFNMSADS